MSRLVWYFHLLLIIVLLISQHVTTAGRARDRYQRRRERINRRRYGYLSDAAAGGNQPCPVGCGCSGRSVSCSKAGLTTIPTELPDNVERLNLQSNRISLIRRSDFSGLTKLRILQLQNNRIERIEPGSFDELTQLERLRLNRNRITELPDGLFTRQSNLYRLDLSYNRLTFIGKDTLSGAPRLRNLQLDHNDIRCLTESALRGLERLEVLTLNRNNISTLPENAFSRMARLKTLRLADNNFICDCRLAWLSRWLRQQPQLGLHTKCSQPRLLFGSQVAELSSSDFQCSADHHKLYPSACAMAERANCPRQCYCQEDNVRCNQKDLSEVPEDIPTNVQELHLENNKITLIRRGTFRRLTQLRRLFLNGNQISRLEEGAFEGLDNLYSLVLSRNSIRELPRGIFQGLKFLQLLLLDANKLTCIPEDIFHETRNLAILSLYKNEIKSIAETTFAPLRSIQQLTIAGNPFVCDCNLRWLNDFLREHPRLASSDNVCDSPDRMARKKLGEVASRKFRCRDGESEATRNAGRCELYAECPANCKCEGDTVDCSWKRLTSLPKNLPVATRHLKLSDNMIRDVPVNSILKKLKNLQSIDLSNNLIATIEPDSFRENSNLEVLNLSGNKLRSLDPRMLSGLDKLKILQMSNNHLSCLNSDTFQETPNITVLSVSQNQIRCVMEGTFDTLQNLTSLHLDLNPLHCNCHMKWLPPFAVANHQLMRNSQPLCRSPDLLKDTPVVSLQSRHFVCQQDPSMGCQGVPPCCSGDAVSCDHRAFCPKKCECEGSVVRCIGQGLTEVPDHIPVDSTQLFLGQNLIEQLNFTRLNRLRNLKLLDLSHNQLYGLKSNMFANMSNLESLSVSFNKLACVEARAFAGLSKLKVLILQGNDINSLPFGSFDDLSLLTTIGLNQNPIHCDCNVKWLIDFFQRRGLDNGLSLCASPPDLAMKPIYHARPDDFVCTTATQLNHSKCNICSTEPCLNGGTCRTVSYDRFACDCPAGFEGKRCQNRLDACFGSPCHNQAECEVLRFGRYRCRCKIGFSGTHCETNIDDCIGHRCQNNATCLDGVNNYTCSCSPGFTGRYCETRLHYCTHYNPCQNGGECLTDPAIGYRCKCVTGWEGRNCDTNPDNCRRQTQPCMNGGSCIDGIGSYTCQCRPGYTGRLCERLEMASLIMDVPDAAVNRGVCTHHECLNGGRCIQEGSEYRCQCLAGYEGKKCEKLTQVGFYDDSFARIETSRIYPSGNITMEMATQQRQGLLLYAGNASAYLIMSLFNGYIRFSYSLGVAPGANGYTYVKINDGKFHTVQAIINRETVTLSVDGMAKTISATYVADAVARSVDALSEAIYIGTLPAAKRDDMQSNVNIRETFSFGGCVKRMLVNGKLVNFKLSDPTNRRLIAGCPAFAKPANPCEKPNLCKNRGVCQPRVEQPAGYRCKCRPNFTGRNCEEKACKRLASREYYTDPETGCRSRRKLKIRRCQGTCLRSTGYCCQPKRLRHRMIKFLCPGGRRITKRVTLVRRCGCAPCGRHNLYSYWYHRTRARR
ncbi:hypothetical protein BOX15_Mlig016971g3 [Macrostomum lignano]|uniref:Protein slit n=1 Tax=Macrostomum lignano TaxID=282301 RepID=A0A267GH93_9PLAT|nr:hypothetical protein BOX15_Mlig016971g3 [Macrostomum lignano]